MAVEQNQFVVVGRSMSGQQPVGAVIYATGGSLRRSRRPNNDGTVISLVISTMRLPCNHRITIAYQI